MSVQAQCPICRTMNIVPERLTLGKWRHRQEDGTTIYFIHAAEGRHVLEVWEDREETAHGLEWHWHYVPLDQCCGKLPGRSARTKADAQSAALAAFQEHAASVGTVLTVS